MEILEKAQKIARDNEFQLTYHKTFGVWIASHYLTADDQVIDVWVSCFGDDPLLVAKRAADTEYRPGRSAVRVN